MLSDDQRRKAIGERVDYWAKRLKVSPPKLRVRRMKRKWGSCSGSGYITLAHDLADQEPGFQDFVIAHELLHLRVPNHGKLFKALLAAHVPDWRRHEIAKSR
ncbi:MAG: M48 family metallopeptidase [Chloroflexi bacterium]|nr:M48 family metallopeptidase [Chloroflexota bacterium]